MIRAIARSRVSTLPSASSYLSLLGVTRRPGRSRGHALHHHRRLPRLFQLGHQPGSLAPFAEPIRPWVSGSWTMESMPSSSMTICPSMPSLTGSLARVEAPLGSIGLPRQCIYFHSRLLNELPDPENTGMAPSRPCQSSNSGRRRLGGYPHQRHLDHRRPDLPRNRYILSGCPPASPSASPSRGSAPPRRLRR